MNVDNEFLKNLISKPKKISDLKVDRVSEIFNKAKDILRDENLLLKIENKDPEEKVMVIGDVHGNLSSLKELINYIEKNSPKYVVFLGDIVDRGSKQLECLIIILSIKILDPERYLILRGNHETEAMNRSYGFYTEFIQRYQDYDAYDKLLELYELLPICAVINDAVVCLHGGVPEDFDILNKIKGIKTKKLSEGIQNDVEDGIFQIMWNDPKEGIGYFKDSFRGPGIKFFGKKAFEEFMNTYNFKYLIRAHECFPEGFRWFFDTRLLTIFSSENYRGMASPNPATFAIVQNKQVRSRILE
ncbi:MAG: Serine/threonine-protein phosphatase 1 [Promethearchaeota archaeon]|nr:MAG: Serine/threonine-protein phosphatase 1 [Candidatus Lokiarchaeota archaeon]